MQPWSKNWVLRSFAKQQVYMEKLYATSRVPILQGLNLQLCTHVMHTYIQRFILRLIIKYQGASPASECVTSKTWIPSVFSPWLIQHTSPGSPLILWLDQASLCLHYEFISTCHPTPFIIINPIAPTPMPSTPPEHNIIGPSVWYFYHHCLLLLYVQYSEAVWITIVSKMEISRRETMWILTHLITPLSEPINISSHPLIKQVNIFRNTSDSFLADISFCQWFFCQTNEFARNILSLNIIYLKAVKISLLLIKNGGWGCKSQNGPLNTNWFVFPTFVHAFCCILLIVIHFHFRK